jgi:hypothetical protein
MRKQALIDRSVPNGVQQWREGRYLRLATAAMSLLAAVCGCAILGVSRHSTPEVTLPAARGWYAGERVYYITTEITDPTMATNAGITFAPRLKDAILAYGKPGVIRSVLERVYKFPDGDQDAVFASVPRPPGPLSTDAAYSPLWLAYFVRWEHPDQRRLLTSEEAILAAADAGTVRIERSDIVINCPIVQTATGGVLPHARLTP